MKTVCDIAAGKQIELNVDQILIMLSSVFLPARIPFYCTTALSIPPTKAAPEATRCASPWNVQMADQFCLSTLCRLSGTVNGVVPSSNQNATLQSAKVSLVSSWRSGE